MATTHSTDSQFISADGKEVLILTEAEASALRALLYEVADEDRFRDAAQGYGFALGSNQIDTLVRLEKKLN
jgi:hypothetical protein